MATSKSKVAYAELRGRMEEDLKDHLEQYKSIANKTISKQELNRLIDIEKRKGGWANLKKLVKASKVDALLEQNEAALKLFYAKAQAEFKSVRLDPNVVHNIKQILHREMLKRELPKLISYKLYKFVTKIFKRGKK